ncbi:MAG: phage tail tape measure protein, partial [Aristaeellaceae bacterium]
MVTGKSESEVNRLGQSYRTLAKTMKVSSTEIATAAVEFWRQGLDESEVNARLTASIQYAKISAMEFDEAAELITAATNTMEISAQRAADVFAYLGDASASGPDEIGIAMQKASASAVEFGLTFEWLGAYIATISEQTRQAPEVIGTAINSIMARLHSIKAKGYTEEDETKINDVAQALGTIDVALLDNEGNWRAMSDIFSDIAAQWDTLDSKTKSYIATTMAGTRQQNYFLALMNDMSKGVEGGSRAYELYAGALNAAGTAAQKYAVWQDSVTAAQNRLTAAAESFYALLDAEWMKDFYNGMAGLVEVITAGTDALGGWNLMIPVVAAGVAGLVAVVIKAAAAIKTMTAALSAGSGIAAAMSGGSIGAIIAAVGMLAAVVTMIAGVSARADEIRKVDYAGTIQSVSGYRDAAEALVSELETLAERTELSADEQSRADEIMRTLSGTSLSMKAALENGGEGFDTLGEKAAAARGELERTEQVLRSLNAADALQNLRDDGGSYSNAIREAQQNLTSVSQYREIAHAYAQFMAEHPEGLYAQSYTGPHGMYASKDENFYVYAKNQAEQPMPVWYSREDKARIQADRDFWAGVVSEMDALGLDYASSVETISNKMLEFDIAAGAYAEANRQALEDAWQPVFDDLYTVMTDGTQFAQLPSFMQDAAIRYYDGFIAGIDRQAELAEGDLMAMAADLTGKVDAMAEYVDAHADFDGIIKRFDELLGGEQTQETVDELNSLLPVVNEFITAYNALTETTDDDIPLFPEFTLDSLRQAQQEMEATEESIASLDTDELYRKLAIAREEANRFGSVLARLGEGEGQFDNLHDAVLSVAGEIAAGLNITDAKVIGEIGDALLEGLYETYPGIADYVDTATGMLTDGWQEGVAKAANPWAEFFDKARLEDALKAAKKDMASLDASELWTQLLDPNGMGLYAYAEDWARRLLPEGTEEEVIALAGQFVDAFFEMFADIDTTIMDANGRIEAGMDGVVATMREKVAEAQREATQLETAYNSLHSGQIARDEAIAGLTSMAGLARSGDSAGVLGVFEGMSAESIQAITEAMPELIDRLVDGTWAAEDFDEAIRRIDEVASKTGSDAWADYLSGTAEGMKSDAGAMKEAMRSVIAEVAAAEDKTAAFYSALTRLESEGIDIGALLEQFGTLAMLLLNGAASADELYTSLDRLGNLRSLQIDLEQADSLSAAARAIDPSNAAYDPLSALDAYALLEAEYVELTALQRGSAEYIARARQLTQEQTAAVYEQAAAYGVVSDIQAKSAQYAANAQRERRFDRAEANGYAGAVSYLEEAVRQAEENGEDVVQAWNNALGDLDEAGVLEGMIAMFGDISNLALACGGDVAKIVEGIYAMQEAANSTTLSDMAQSLREERAANAAGTDGYQDQIGALLDAFGSGGTEGVENAMAVWNSFDESLRQSIAETYPSLVIALDDANQAAEALKEGTSELEGAQGDLSDASRSAGKQIDALGKELNSAQKSSTARYFKNTAAAIEDLKHGTISVSDAFGAYNKEAEKAVKANEQYQVAAKKMAQGMQVATDEIDVLAEYLGNIDPEVLLANWDQVGPMMAAALAEGEAAFDRLNEAAFICITGTSVADFSALTNGLVSVKNLAAETVQALIATGQWTTETITLPQEGAQWDPVSGTWTRTMLNTNQTVLKYTGSNPLRSGGGSSGSGSSGGGGKGGGGGSSSTEVSKSIQKMLDQMDEDQGFEDHYRKMAQLAQGYHEARGEIQGVILYLEKERALVADNTETLRGYVRTLETQIEQKQAELAKYKEGSKKYKQAAVDLEALQSAHQQYSEQLLENMTDLEELQDQIEEWHNTVREMEIDLRELIHDAILDREALNQRMLEGRIDLENELMDVLTRRYEKERDELIEVAELKREALNEELSALDEQLEARKKLNEQQDRAKLLAEKEAQLARISADPTRKKEELALREEIAELREELAWELAEEEVNAQKKSIEAQIDSIDEYIEYVENYYEELLSNPRKLIEELQELMTRSDEEILAWLEANHEEYET